MNATSVIKALLRPVYHPPRSAWQYVRARRIVRDYAQNYENARRLYLASGHAAPPAVPSLDRLGVRVISPAASDGVAPLPSGYGSQVAALAEAIDRRFARTENCLFMPKIEREALPPLTADVAAIRDGQVISLQLRDVLGVPGLGSFVDLVVPFIERTFFGSFVVVDKVYAYRNLVSRQREQVSWLWHYDNHPTQVIKIMVYLTDVDAETAPFEYVRRRDTGEPLMFTPLPLRGNSRVAPATVEGYLQRGYERHLATGPRGTMLVFDDNVLHKANLARRAHRDVLVLQLRPATFEPQPRLDPRWSGSFEHDDFNQNPDDYRSHLKRHRFSG